jgi:hypothetical protein
MFPSLASSKTTRAQVKNATTVCGQSVAQLMEKERKVRQKIIGENFSD